MRYIIICAFLFIICFMGCGSNKKTVNEKSLETDLNQIDFLSYEWIAPTNQRDESSSWEIAQYIPNLATPSNEGYSIWMDHVVFGEGAVYILLHCEKDSEDGSTLGYELKKVDLESLEVRTIWTVYDTANLGGNIESYTFTGINELLVTGQALITSLDVDGSKIALFLSTWDDEGLLNKFYKVLLNDDGSIDKAIDYSNSFSDFYKEDNLFVLPELICGKDDEIYLIARDKKQVVIIEKDCDTTVVDINGSHNELIYLGNGIEGTPIFSCNSGNGITEYFYIDKSGKHDLLTADVPSGMSSIDPYGNVLVLNSSTLSRWNTVTGEMSMLYSFYGLSSYSCLGMTENSKGEIVICYQEGIDAFLYKLNDEDHSVLKELTLLQDFAEPYTEKCAEAYSRTHPGIRIYVERMDGSDDYEWSKLLERIKKGDGPDIVLTNRRKLSDLKEAGIICNLSDCLDENDLNDLFQGALQYGEFDSQLYALPCNVEMEALIVSNSTLTDKKWTPTEMMDMYETWKSKHNGEGRFVSAYCSVDASGILGILCLNKIERVGFVDVDNNVCDFKNETFYRILRFCRDNAETPQGLGSYKQTDELIDDFVKERAFTIYLGGGLAPFSNYVNILGDNYHVIGYPSVDDSGVFVSCNSGVALNSLSNNKEIATDFITALIGEDYQVKYTTEWLNKDVLRKHVKDAFEMTNHSEHDTHHLEEPAFEINSRAHVPLAGKPDGTSYLEEYITYMDSGVPLSIEYDIQDIILEETSSFFSGEKTEQEVADIIQNRVQIYLDERK